MLEDIWCIKFAVQNQLKSAVIKSLGISIARFLTLNFSCSSRYVCRSHAIHDLGFSNTLAFLVYQAHALLAYFFFFYVDKPCPMTETGGSKYMHTHL
jgi:hypothetical protein